MSKRQLPVSQLWCSHVISVKTPKPQRLPETQPQRLPETQPKRLPETQPQRLPETQPPKPQRLPETQYKTPLATWSAEPVDDLQAPLFPFLFPAAMYRKNLPLFLKSFLRSFSPCHKTTKKTTSKTTYCTRKQRCLGLQEQPKDPQIKLENLQPKKLKCLQQEQSKSLQLKQGCIKEP